MKIAKNSIHKVDITGISNLGFGICHIDGMVGFVQGGVTGDTVEAKVIKVARDYLVLRIEKILVASKHRTSSDCSIANKCGGCVFRHITYDYEKQLKRDYVESAFRKAGLDVNIVPVTSNDKVSGYRNKVQYPVGPNGEIGYYKQKTHDIIECLSCPLESPQSNEITNLIASFIKENAVSNVRHIFVRRGFATGEIMVCLVVYDHSYDNLLPLFNELKEINNIKSISVNINPDDTNVIMGKETIDIYGNGFITDILCGLPFKISTRSFYQVNHDMAEMLYNKAIELANLKDGERFVDLYCGIGTIGLCVASKVSGVTLTGIEIIPDAVENARENAKACGIDNAQFICGDAGALKDINADLVIVDPPRKGITEELVDTITKANIDKVVYVSCNPDTLARDCKWFSNRGFTISTVYPFDLFPRTSHVESVVLLTKV